MYKSKKYGWLVDSGQLPPRQRWGSIIGGVAGIFVGIFIADRYVPNGILNFLAIAVFAAAGNILGMYLTRPRSG